MTKHFNIFNCVDVDPEEVRAIRDARSVGLMEAKGITKAMALHTELCNMRYRLGRFEDMSDGEVLDELLDVLITGVEF